MTVSDEVLRALQARPAGMTDANLAALLGKRHQHINMTCRGLAAKGLIARESSTGGIINKIIGEASASAVPQVGRPTATTHEEWAWEGNVQSRVVTHLAANSWSIVRVADTARREQGIDIVAQRNGQQLLVEVKGWPGTTYASGERAGQPKPTQPTLQATHWFAEGLTTLIRRGTQRGTRLALALPDMPRYRSLLDEAAWALERLNITVYLVTADGSVQEREREN